MFADLFTPRGRWNRLNRLSYAVGHLLLMLLLLVLGFVLGKGLSLLRPEVVPAGLVVLDLVGLALVLWVVFCLGFKRVHDLDKPGWWAVGLLVPGPNVLLWLYLLFMPGTVGDNDYGEDPREL